MTDALDGKMKNCLFCLFIRSIRSTIANTEESVKEIVAALKTIIFIIVSHYSYYNSSGFKVYISLLPATLRGPKM